MPCIAPVCLSLLCVRSSSFFHCSLSFHFIPALFWRLVPLVAFSFFFASFLCSTLLLSRLTSPVPWYMHVFFQSLCPCLVFLDFIAFRCGLKIGQTCVIVHCFYYCFCKQQNHSFFPLPSCPQRWSFLWQFHPLSTVYTLVMLHLFPQEINYSKDTCSWQCTITLKMGQTLNLLTFDLFDCSRCAFIWLQMITLILALTGTISTGLIRGVSQFRPCLVSKSQSNYA